MSKNNHEDDDDDDTAPFFQDLNVDQITFTEPPKKPKRGRKTNMMAFLNTTNGETPCFQFDHFAPIMFDPGPGLDKSRETNPNSPVNLELTVPESNTAYHEKCAQIDAKVLAYALKWRDTLWPGKNYSDAKVQSMQCPLLKQHDGGYTFRGKMLPPIGESGEPNSHPTAAFLMLGKSEHEEDPSDIYDIKAKDRALPIGFLRNFWASSQWFSVSVAIPRLWYRKSSNLKKKVRLPGIGAIRARKANSPATTQVVVAGTKRNRTDTADPPAKRAHEDADEQGGGGGGSKDDDADEQGGDDDDDYDNYTDVADADFE